MTAIANRIYHVEPNQPEATKTEPVPHAAAPRSPETAPSKKAIWTGRALSGLATLFLAFDGTMKVLQVPAVVEATTQLGYPTSVTLGLGIVEIVCLAAYLVPRTAILGAVVWTGYLGGAIATHVRLGNPLFSHVLFPTYIAALIWGGLWLREPRLRALLPLRAPK